MRLALPQAGLVLFQASPDAPDEDLNPALGPELIVSLIFFLQSVSGFFKRKLFTDKSHSVNSCPFGHPAATL